eukprot:3754000-Rhodomonas_salina.3
MKLTNSWCLIAVLAVCWSSAAAFHLMQSPLLRTECSRNALPSAASHLAIAPQLRPAASSLWQIPARRRTSSLVMMAKKKKMTEAQLKALEALEKFEAAAEPESPGTEQYAHCARRDVDVLCCGTVATQEVEMPAPPGPKKGKKKGKMSEAQVHTAAYLRARCATPRTEMLYCAAS